MGHSILLGNLLYVLLPVLIMCYASYTVFSMMEQFKLQKKSSIVKWSLGAATVFGLSLWTMNVVLLIASDYRLIIDWSMGVSLLASLTATYAGLLLGNRESMIGRRNLLSAILFTTGTAMLYYMYFFSNYVQVLSVNSWQVGLSVIAGFAGAYVALYWLRQKSSFYKLKSSIILGVSSMVMQQLSMNAVTVAYEDVLTTNQLNDFLPLFFVILCISANLILSFSLSTWRNSRKYTQIDERYKLLVENSMDAIALIKQGRWEYMNPSGLRLFEAKNDQELFGTSIYQLLDKQHHNEMVRLLETEHDAEKVPAQPIELQWQTLTGARLHTEWVRVRTSFLGSPIEQVIIRDISERKKNEKLLINSEKLAIAGQLAAGIAHEIRNPLTSLKGFLQLMDSGRIHDKRYYKIMKSEVVRIETIVSGLLMMSKPQAYDYSYMDARHIMKDSIELLESQASLFNVRMEYQADDQPMWVKGVENQLKQGFINVLENAIEAMQNGGVVMVDLSLDSESNVRIRIQDEGSGLSEDQISKIGQPFYTTKDKGTGLGLMVTYKIIANHQGHISAESEMGIGTTFTIRLPHRCPVDSTRMLNQLV